MKHKDVDSQGYLNFMKHKQATFIFNCVLSVNIRANSKTVNPYIPSLSKQVTGFPSYLAVTAFPRGCCYLQSLCNTPCAKITEFILPGRNSCPVALKLTNTYSWNWADHSFTLAASGTTLFQEWYVPFHQTGIRQGGPTDTQMPTPGQYTGSFELQKLTKQKPEAFSCSSHGTMRLCLEWSCMMMSSLNCRKDRQRKGKMTKELKGVRAEGRL